MENAEFKKIQSSFNNSKNNVHNIDDKELKNKYTDDISDSDEQDMKKGGKKKRELKETNAEGGAGGGAGGKANGHKEAEAYGQGDEGGSAKANGQGDDGGSEGSEGSDGEEGYELHNDFKTKVVSYVKADDKIRDLQNQLKDYRKIKKDSEEGILRHLERLGENMINVTGGKLRKNQYESKAALKKELIKETLSEKIKDVLIVEELLNKMEDKREVKINVSIKRTYEREKKGKT
jgi:hypothetical protein